MANYEFMLILDPSLSEEDRTASITEMKSTLEKYSAKIEKEDIWGEKKLSYKINRSEKGYYILLDIELDWTKIKDISKNLNLQTNIWRYMFVKKEA